MTKRQKIILWLVAAVFILCGIAWILWWLLVGQFYERTDDAYVNGNMIMITPQEEGIVTTILVDNTQMVKAGQPLLQLDRHDFEIALEKAKADLADAVRTVSQLFLKVEELKAKKEVKTQEVIRTRLDYEHRLPLVEDQSVSIEEFEHSETALAAAIFALKEVEKQLESAEAEIENTTIATHPKVEQAKAALRKAYLSLHRSRVVAPTSGVITQRKAQVGQWVHASDPLMALVPIEQMWVDANFREVSLKNLRIDQPVTLFSDMYGSDLIYHGKVVGLNPGTGSIFSILPPQNATGNWIKIVQRVSVKIALDCEELQKHPLVLGLSMTVKADTTDRKGLQLPCVSHSAPLYVTDVYADELVGSEQLIDQIISSNKHEL